MLSFLKRTICIGIIICFVFESVMTNQVFSAGEQEQNSGICINEVMSSNKTAVADEDGDYSDWIELYNGGAYSINLDEYFISDDKDNLMKWQFPECLIVPQGFLVVWMSGKDRKGINGELHTNFKINAGGEKLYLVSPGGKDLADKVDMDFIPEDQSYCRQEDGKDNWVLATATPGNTNSAASLYRKPLRPPVFEQKSGYYDTEFALTLKNEQKVGVIYYTEDGSIPDPVNNAARTKKYTSAINITKKTDTKNYFSMIPTNPQTNVQGGYSQSRVDSRGWLPPYGEVNKINVIKAIVYQSEKEYSDTVTRTYIIDKNTRYTLPVVSITTNEESFFSEDKGIYIYGNQENYNEDGETSERPIYIEMFDKNGEKVLSQAAGARIRGGGSRHSAQKSLSIYAREKYGKDRFKYKFSNDREVKEIKHFQLRSGGQSPNQLPRDDLAGMIAKPLNIATQQLTYVIVFLNGEYWGIHSLKECFDEHYVEEVYGVDSDQVTILEDNQSNLAEGSPEDQECYRSMENFVNSNEMSIDENYEYVKTLMDVDSYIDYQIAEIYLANVDWPDHNIRYWRCSNGIYTGEFTPTDGRWRWMLYDLDSGFGSTSPNVSIRTNILSVAKSMLLGHLLNNTEFRQSFINRFADVLNTTFSPDVVKEKINNIKETLSPELLEHVKRWRYPSIAQTYEKRKNEVPATSAFDRHIAQLNDFADQRPDIVRGDLIKEFGLGGTVQITLKNDISKAALKINSILVDDTLMGGEKQEEWKGTYFKNNPIRIEAVPKPGYVFERWEGIPDIKENPAIVNLAGNAAITAVYKEVQPLQQDGN